MNYKQFRLEVIMRVAIILDNSDCSNYQFLGYKHHHQRLILYFDDCKQVYDFNLSDSMVNETSFYTKNFSGNEKLQSVVAFNKAMKKDIPDNKKNKNKP